MYGITDYLRRGVRFVNNTIRPGHKTLSTLMLYSTNLCDSKCIHCHVWSKRPVEHLSMEKIIEIMNSKCVSKHTVVGLEGGEFLLHPQAMEIMQWLKKNHPNFDLLSNCLKPNRVIEAVKAYPPRRLFISLDGTKETYQYMRGKDGYDKVLQVIESCKDLVPISLMFTLSPYNSFNDMEHVVGIAQKYSIDIRIGIYGNIAFFDTVDKAHETEIGILKNNDNLNIEDNETTINKFNTLLNSEDFKKQIPKNVIKTSENLDFILLYDEWRKKKLKMKCRSIIDSLVIHPNGDVPICQNLDVKLGNVNKDSLDNIFNSVQTQLLHKKYVNTCNECWINFHRKYDIVLMRNVEKIMPKWLAETIFGKYQWTEDTKMTYKKFMKNNYY